MSQVIWPNLKILSFQSFCKIFLTFYQIVVFTHYSKLQWRNELLPLSLLLLLSFFFLFLSLTLYLSLCSTQGQVFRISKTRLPVLWQLQLCEFWYCTNLILFDVPPQGFKGKTGHVGFPGQKVSTQLIALPSHCVCLLTAAPSCLCVWPSCFITLIIRKTNLLLLKFLCFIYYHFITPYRVSLDLQVHLDHQADQDMMWVFCLLPTMSLLEANLD